MTVRADIQTDGHIVIPLRGVELVACGRMGCAQLWEAQMIAQNRHEQSDRQRDINTYRDTYT